jgi:AsmA-like C-terminal region
MPPRARLALKIAGVAAAAILVVLVVAAVAISRHLKDLVPAWLAQHYNGTVEVGDFHASMAFPFVLCDAGNVTLHFKGRENLPPMIAIRKLTLRASIWQLLRSPARIASVQLEGLQLNIPPRDDRGNEGGVKNFGRRTREVRFGEIRADGTVLKILTRKPGKSPREFDIRELRLSSSDPEGALEFHAKLSNPMPPGEITSSGLFGPWNLDVPSQTPVKGAYTFENADLGVFRGIAGILSSTGQYQGELDEINAQGTTDTPDFRVTRAGHTVDLKTTFDATINGTDGDTYLHPVEAHVGKTVLISRGKVEHREGEPGKQIVLDVNTENGRIEDLLQLAVKEKPPMTGPVRLKTDFELNAGPKNILDRLNLDGSFGLDGIHFTQSGVQQRVDNMSKRAEREPREVIDPSQAIAGDDVASNMKGGFRLKDGVLTLTAVQFQIPGAALEISGTYALEPEELELYGTIRMQAALSQTTTGFKSVLLRLADRFFSKNGHTVLPIKITGTVQHPHYSLDLHRKEEKGAERKR